LIGAPDGNTDIRGKGRENRGKQQPEKYQQADTAHDELSLFKEENRAKYRKEVRNET